MCGNCKFYDKPTHECRAHPPTVTDEMPDGEWPTVKPEWFCGEWQSLESNLNSFGNPQR